MDGGEKVYQNYSEASLQEVREQIVEEVTFVQEIEGGSRKLIDNLFILELIE